jgi:hypothetical protein
LGQVRQPATGDVFGDATPVVNDFEVQVILDFDGHAKLAGVGMSRDVTDRFTHNSFGMIGQARVNHGEWSDELRRDV